MSVRAPGPGCAAIVRPPVLAGQVDTGVGGATVHRLPRRHDPRGTLTVAEHPGDLPFEVARYFLVYDVPAGAIRGEHAHIRCQQFLVCTAGSCTVIADDAHRRVEVVLDDPATGIYLPAGIWGVQHSFSPGAVLLVLASHPYDAADYQRDYAVFVQSRRRLRVE